MTIVDNSWLVWSWSGVGMNNTVDGVRMDWEHSVVDWKRNVGQKELLVEIFRNENTQSESVIDTKR